MLLHQFYQEMNTYLTKLYLLPGLQCYPKVKSHAKQCFLIFVHWQVLFSPELSMYIAEFHLQIEVTHNFFKINSLASPIQFNHDLANLLLFLDGNLLSK